MKAILLTYKTISYQNIFLMLFTNSCIQNEPDNAGYFIKAYISCYYAAQAIILT